MYLLESMEARRYFSGGTHLTVPPLGHVATVSSTVHKSAKVVLAKAVGPPTNLEAVVANGSVMLSWQGESAQSQVSAPAFERDLGPDPVSPIKVDSNPVSPNEGGVVTLRFITHFPDAIATDALAIDWSDNTYATPTKEPSHFGVFNTGVPNLYGFWATHLYAQGGSYLVESFLFNGSGVPASLDSLISDLPGRSPIITHKARVVSRSGKTVQLAVDATGPSGAPLIYHWLVSRNSHPIVSPAFSNNDDDTAATTLISVFQLGVYKFQVVVDTIGSLFSISDVLVNFKAKVAFSRLNRVDAGLT